MPSSLKDGAVQAALAAACQPGTTEVPLDGETTRIVPRPFPSPVDWRDHWIYFLMVDRFDNPAAPPRLPWDRDTGDRQGGTFEGVRRRLDYIRALGAGAIWLTPILANRASDESHHGYGIADFLEVDPRFGSQPGAAEAEFVRLVDEAHARGLYVILDIVINHAGDVFAYDIQGENRDSADWSDVALPIHWRDEHGAPRSDWSEAPAAPPRGAALWPSELRANRYMRRQGKGGPVQGDFETLKEFHTEIRDALGDRPVWNHLIRAYQYVIAKFDVDGFRIDTLKHVEREFALTFCNAVREYALSIGKKNFFIFGETKDGEDVIAEYTGRYGSDDEGCFGADATLDFPLQWRLPQVAKGMCPPTDVEDVFALRRRVQQEKHLLGTHGDASRFFVTFLDNHDDHNRFLHPVDGGDYTQQLVLALGCLFGLQGIPCLYYGTEQGLRGTRDLYEAPNQGKPERVREALWGKPDAFRQGGNLFDAIAALARRRAEEPALRYGRQYFRPVSGNGTDFGPSREAGGIIAVSRILNDREVVVVANTSTTRAFQGWVVVDARLHGDGEALDVLYSNVGSTGKRFLANGDATFYDRSGTARAGWARRVPVELAPCEIQILARRV